MTRVPIITLKRNSFFSVGLVAAHGTNEVGCTVTDLISGRDQNRLRGSLEERDRYMYELLYGCTTGEEGRGQNSAQGSYGSRTSTPVRPR